MDLAALEQDVALIDLLLEPIATAPIDITDPDWVGKMRALPPPIDRVNARAEAEAALHSLISAYGTGDESDRVTVRRIFERYRSFAWAVCPQPPHDTADKFRTYLRYWSALDQGVDTRDELLSLWAACDEAKAAGVDIGPILSEVAAISSDVNKYAMGSTQDLLLNATART